MKYAKVLKINHKFKDTTKDIYVLVIDNPCNKSNFPNEVNKSYFCDGTNLNKKKIFTINNKLVIGLLHNTNVCIKENIDNIKNTIVENCKERNSTNLNNLKYGMGDIFIKMAK